MIMHNNNNNKNFVRFIVGRTTHFGVVVVLVLCVCSLLAVVNIVEGYSIVVLPPPSRSLLLRVVSSSPFSSSSLLKTHKTTSTKAVSSKTYTSMVMMMSKNYIHETDNDDKTNFNVQDNNNNDRRTYYIAIITETDACDNRQRMEETYTAITQAVSTGHVNLVSIRLEKLNKKINQQTGRRQDQTDEQEMLAIELTKKLVDLSSETSSLSSTSSNGGEEEQQQSPSFYVVCSSDWINVATQGGAHGVHVKEKHLSMIPTIRRRRVRELYTTTKPMIIGTSTHSIQSAIESYRMYQPDYYFVGTCYFTQSHPEKTSLEELEGPKLPGQVKHAIQNSILEQNQKQQEVKPPLPPSPIIYAIGGINDSNCNEPVQKYGADGVAVIRYVVAATDPAVAVTKLHTNMKCMK